MACSIANFLWRNKVFGFHFASNANHLVDVIQCVSKLELLKSNAAPRAVCTLASQLISNFAGEQGRQSSHHHRNKKGSIVSQSESSSFNKKSNTSSQAGVPQELRRGPASIQFLLMLAVVVLLVSHNPLCGTNIANGQGSIYPAFVDGMFTLGTADPAAPTPNPYPLGFQLLESNPSSNNTIYLDFAGHVSVNNLWNHGFNFIPYDLDDEPFDPLLGPPFPSFNDEERTNIQTIWQSVAEDFSPFDVNVVTATTLAAEPPPGVFVRSGFSDENFGIRVVLSLIHI